MLTSVEVMKAGEEAIAEFDWATCKDIFDMCDFQYHFNNGEKRIPETYELVSCVRNLLETLSRNPDHEVVSSGRFEVSINVDAVEIKFIAVDSFAGICES